MTAAKTLTSPLSRALNGSTHAHAHAHAHAQTRSQSHARPLLVQKFGGTSVGSPDRLDQVAAIIRSTLAAAHQPIVVLSAMSGSKKTEGTTSKLLEAVEEVLKPNSQRYLDIVDFLETSHIAAVNGAVLTPDNDTAIRDAAAADVRAECQRLRSFMSAAEIVDEISPRSRDVIVSSGEKLSARIFTAVLESRGIKAKYINLDKLVEQAFDEKALDQSFYDYLVVRLAETLEPFVNTHVCVVTGFLGPVPGSLLRSIGRGYTDLTAALVAVALEAEELQIWKEVDGIFTADPRKAPLARKIPSISPEEAAELTYYGSEVIHPFTMEQVIRASIPIRIKNTFNPTGHGTVILPDGRSLSDGSPRPRRDPTMTPVPKHPTAVTIKDNVIVLNVHSNRKSVSHGFFAQIFLALDRYGIVVDLISTSEVHISMALNPSITDDKLKKALVELNKYGTVDVIRDMAILSLVGKDMRHMVGVASRMFETLAAHNINIEMISQGASEINISCVIDEANAVTALRAVHDELIIAAADASRPVSRTSPEPDAVPSDVPSVVPSVAV
ncbi:Aspartate/glutamate/uridylate kinase [Entophlyctis helioformis]|nr:Aspartate/glutamate/uridylate kinase [Entophlyctis helioformis]